MASTWVLVPDQLPPAIEDIIGEGLKDEAEKSSNRSAVDASPELGTESDDSVSEFDIKLWKLLPGLHNNDDVSVTGQHVGTRKSER